MGKNKNRPSEKTEALKDERIVANTASSPGDGSSVTTVPMDKKDKKDKKEKKEKKEKKDTQVRPEDTPGGASTNAEASSSYHTVKNTEIPDDKKHKTETANEKREKNAKKNKEGADPKMAGRKTETLETRGGRDEKTRKKGEKDHGESMKPETGGYGKEKKKDAAKTQKKGDEDVKTDTAVIETRDRRRQERKEEG